MSYEYLKNKGLAVQKLCIKFFLIKIPDIFIGDQRNRVQINLSTSTSRHTGLLVYTKKI